VFASSGSFFVEILMSNVFFVNFELRDRYADVGHHLLFQDAPSFIQKYAILFFIDFHVLALPGSSRAHLDVRLEKSVPTALISSSVLTA
jgi:hypothetical protein